MQTEQNQNQTSNEPTTNDHNQRVFAARHDILRPGAVQDESHTSQTRCAGFIPSKLRSNT